MTEHINIVSWEFVAILLVLVVIYYDLLINIRRILRILASSAEMTSYDSNAPPLINNKPAPLDLPDATMTLYANDAITTPAVPDHNDIKQVQWPSRRINTEMFIGDGERRFPGKFMYTKSVYVNTKTPIKIMCNAHNLEFEQLPVQFLRNGMCPQCTADKNEQTRRRLEHEFLAAAEEKHGNLYDNSTIRFENHQTKVAIKCRLHGIFHKYMTEYVNGIGCPDCSYNKNESLLFTWLIGQFGNDIPINVRFDQCVHAASKQLFTYNFQIGKILILVDNKERFREMKRPPGFMPHLADETEKAVTACKMGFNIIRIYKPAVTIDNEEWQHNIMRCVSDIKSADCGGRVFYVGNAAYDRFQVAYTAAASRC